MFTLHVAVRQGNVGGVSIPSARLTRFRKCPHVFKMKTFTKPIESRALLKILP